MAYLLWLFVGVAGGHRFYVGRTRTAAAMLVGVLGGFILPTGIGAPLIAGMAIWAFVDAFLIPQWVKTCNADRG